MMLQEQLKKLETLTADGARLSTPVQQSTWNIHVVFVRFSSIFHLTSERMLFYVYMGLQLSIARGMETVKIAWVKLNLSLMMESEVTDRLFRVDAVA